MAQSLPAVPSAEPGLPEDAEFVEFTGWNGIDTKPPRAGTPQQKAFWCHNLMPQSPNNLVAIPDCADAFYTATDDLTIGHFDFFGLQPGFVNSGPWMIAFLSDGSAVAQNVDNPALQVNIAAAGTFSYPADQPPAVQQYGIQYLLIVDEQSEDAYWIWDGVLLYGPGTISPEVNLTSGGIGYTSPPTVTIFGGSGGGATFSADVLNGAVDLVTPTSVGTGWISADAPEALLLFSGGGSGTSAYGTAQVVNGAIVSATVINGGTGFTGIPTIVITDPTGSGATIVASSISGGVITGLTVTQCGSGYTNPTLGTSGGGGSGFSGNARLENGVIAGYNVGSVGSGYGEAPQVVFISPTGSGASATAILSGGTVTGISFGVSQFTGKGYPTLSTVVVGFVAGNGPASGTVQLMPFGIHGSTIEVYNSQVWIGTAQMGVKTIWSAPDSVANFGPPAGGGAQPATQSNLRYQWTRLIQSNGFLYQIGDSSANYISGVQTTGTPATTTFSDLNIDPQIGSPWRDSCVPYSRAVMIANNFGVHAIYGGAIQKVSTDIDELFPGGDFAGDMANVLAGPSSAIATLFGVHVYLLLLPITDPLTGTPENILCVWDGTRWYTADQKIPLCKIATLEWAGDIHAFGLSADKKTVHELFTTPSTNTQKILVSRLNRAPSIAYLKKAWMLYAMWQGAATLTFTWDTETGTTPITQGTFVGTATSDLRANWARSKAPDAIGYATGFTMTSTAATFTIVDILQLQLRRRLKT